MRFEPTPLELLEFDVDLRLGDVWREASEVETWDLEVVSKFLRASYARGYYDALAEPVEGSLCLEHKYRVPARRAA